MLRPFIAAVLLTLAARLPSASAQSADWKRCVYREPQVRYLIADMQMGGDPALYRKYAQEGDPDSRQAVRRWDAGSRVINTNDFERKWVANAHGKDGRVMRIVHRGSDRTIGGHEIILSSDLVFQQGPMRAVLADLTLGTPTSAYASRAKDPNVAEALRRWADGVRATNTERFERRGQGRRTRVVYRATDNRVDGAQVRLNCDPPYPESNVRYFMADIALGASIEFYRHSGEKDHEMGCLEAVRRTEEGYRITNLEELERKRVGGQMLITRKGSDERISGMVVRLSSDALPDQAGAASQPAAR
jgi:hypothetical protein